MALPERPPPDPARLLASWMEWERAETPPGRVMSNLKTGGLRELLEELVEAEWAMPAGAAPPAEASSPGAGRP
ncbi:MAG: hypothetical protein ACRD0J_09135 [Acidimicrobiales bacterium]